MATAPDLELIEEPIASEGLMLQDILSGENLAEMLEPSELTKIGQNVIRDVEIDESSRKEWLERNERNIEIAMQVKKPKTSPWPKASNIKAPILTVASIQFNAEAYPVIVDGSNLVKGRVLGPDKDGQKRARADRIGQHMTWQLLYRMPGWEAETDRLLLMLPIVGCMFRKTYYDSIENANRSDIVTGEDFIINYWAKSIETAPRYTQILHYYPYEVQEFISAGLWKEVPIDDADTGEDEQALGEYYEQHRCLDLDGDGYPEHYVVTCTKEGEVARIVPCFGIEGITAAIIGPDGQVAKTAKLSEIMEFGQQDQRVWEIVGDIVKIERRQYFTKYGFIPAPDGSFYDIGFGDLLQNTTDTIDSLQNQMIDAATLQNAGAGFLGSGVNIKGGIIRFAMGQLTRVDTSGGPLKDNIMLYPAPGPSAVSFSLLELLLGQAKDITSSQDVVAGRAPPNQPATTTLALIEQAGIVKKGIFKRIWRSFGQELRIMFRLNRDYLDEEEYFQLNDPEPEKGPDGQPIQGPDGPQMTSVAKVGREDYADNDLDVVPVSDPSQVSDTHRMVRAEARFQTFNGDPLINQKLIREDMLQAMGASDISRYFEVPQQGPPPEQILEAKKIDVQEKDADTKRMAALATAAERFAAAAEKLAAIGLLPDAAIQAERSLGEEDEAPDQSGGVPSMGGSPGDGGISPVPQGLPDGAGGGMAEGGAAAPAGPGEGGPVPGATGAPM